MIDLLTDLPDNVVGFEAVGEVTAEDYARVLDPALTAAMRKHGKIRVLYVLGERFTGYSGAAIFEDALVGTEHWRHWERIGVVSDTDWVRHTVHAFAWMVPARIKVFSDAQRDEAISWVCAD